MNTCRICDKPIPARLCFCTRCTQTRLTSTERFELMAPQLAEKRESIAQAIIKRVRGVARTSVPPTAGPPVTARSAFRAARRILAPVIKGPREPQR